ncbi:MAG: hypothetical protein K2K37_00710, partial [Muribaculaceae bacterium]|nr:hypothetical protein [Muribaculaceae bacterium]
MEITQEIDGKLYMYKKIDDRWGFYDFKGNLYTGNKSFAKDLDKIREADPILERMITNIVDSETEVRLFYGNDNRTIPVVDSQRNIYDYNIEYNPTKTIGGEGIAPDGTVTNSRSPEVGLVHELGHIFDRLNPISTNVVYKKHPNLIIKDRNGIHREGVSCIMENIYREAIGEPMRISYRSLKPHKSVASGLFVPINTNIGYSISDKIMMDIITKRTNFSY